MGIWNGRNPAYKMAMTEKEVILFLFLILLHYFDVMTTYYGIEYLGTDEINPFTQYLVYQNYYFLLFIIKIVFTVLMLMTWRTHKIRILIIMSIWFGLIVLRNMFEIVASIIILSR